MYGVSTNVGFGSVIEDLDQMHLTVRRFELARTSMTSWHVVFTKATHAIGGYGPTALQENRMRAAAERQCGKPCLWLYYGPRMGNEQGSNNDVLYVSSILGLGSFHHFQTPTPGFATGPQRRESQTLIHARWPQVDPFRPLLPPVATKPKTWPPLS